MKNLKTYLLLLMVMAMLGSLPAQQNDINDLPYSYDDVVPNLKILPSGTYNTTAKNLNAALQFNIRDIKDSGGQKEYIIHGKTITTSMIKEEVGSSIFISSAGSTFSSPPIVGRMVIVCDTLIMDEQIHLPECDIVIDAFFIDMQNKTLNSSPLPKQYSMEGALQESILDKISTTDLNARKNGRNAGNITINANHIQNSGMIKANGGDGEHRYVPSHTLKLYGLENIERKRNVDFANKGNSRSFNEPFTNMVAMQTNTKEIDCTIACNDDHTRYKNYYEEEIKYDEKGAKISDNRPLVKRIVVSKKYVPGNGGASGNVAVTYNKGNIDGKISQLGGKSGKLLPRNSTKNTMYSTADVPQVSFNSKTVNLYKTNTKYTVNLGIRNPAGASYKKMQSLKVPSDANVQTLNENIKKLIGKSGKSKECTCKREEQKRNHLVYENLLNTLEKQFEHYYLLEGSKKKKINTLLEWISNELDSDLASSSTNKSNLNALKVKTNYLMSRKTSTVDGMGNLPGFRPALSVQALLQYLKGNLKGDISLLVSSEKVLSLELNKKQILDELQSSINELNSQNTKHAEKLDLNYAKSIRLKKLANEAIRQTNKIELEIQKLEAKLAKEANKQAENHLLKVQALKLAAIAASVIPYGQPVLGSIVGNGLNAYAKAVESHEGTDKTALKVEKKGKLKFKHPAIELPPGDLALANHTITKSFFEKTKLEAEKNIENLTKAYKKKRLAEKNKFEKSIEKETDMLRNISDVSRKSINYVAKLKVPSSDIDMFLKKLISASKEYKKLAKNLKSQTETKEKLFKQIGLIISKNAKLNSEIQENGNIMDRLQLLQLRDDFYSENSHSVFQSVRNNAVERLEWAEYSLIKAYEYQSLKTYQSSGSLNEFIDFQLKQLKVNDASINPQEALENAFTGRIRNIAMSILKNVDSSTKQNNEKDKIRSFVIRKSSNQSDLIDRLNNTGEVSIDFMNHFDNVFISPSKQNVKIKDIQIKSIKFKGLVPENSNVDVILNFNEYGLLRSGKNIYSFYTPDNDDVSNTSYSWIVAQQNGKNITSKNEVPSHYSGLVNFLLDSQPTISQDKKENMAKVLNRILIN